MKPTDTTLLAHYPADSAAAERLWDALYLARAAVLYVVGITLSAVGCVGAFLWAPLLWCAVAGLVVIAVSFTISGDRL